MKKTLLLTTVLMLAAGMAFAQQGSIGIFADASGASCNLLDVSPGLTPYFIVHVFTTGSTACQYKAPKPTCMTATFLSDTNPFPVTIGSSQTGVSIAYGTCRVGPIMVQTLNYFTMGTTPECCYYPVLCDPLGVNACANQLLDTVDCQFNPAVATGGKGIVHSVLRCNCNVPAEDTTWGGVKALYTE